MKLITGLCLMLFCLTGQAQQSVFSLCSLATTTGVKTAVQLSPGPKTFQASMTVSSGSGTGAVTVEGSNDNTWFDSIGTLSVTDTASDSVTPYAPAYLWYRCNVTGETGTGAKISVNVRQGENP